MSNRVAEGAIQDVMRKSLDVYARRTALVGGAEELSYEQLGAYPRRQPLPARKAA
jgi:hypothetical protein